MKISDFKSGEVRLPGLRQITLPPGIYLHTAEVPSLRKYFKESFLAISGCSDEAPFLDQLMDKFEMEIHLFMRGLELPDRRNRGFCQIFSPKNGRKYAIIGRRLGETRERAAFTAGHESGHFLELIGQKSILQEWLVEAKIEEDVSQLKGEGLANLAGRLAVYYHDHQIQ